MAPEPSTSNGDRQRPFNSPDETQSTLQTTRDNGVPAGREHQHSQSERQSHEDKADFIQHCDDRSSHKSCRDSRPSPSLNHEHKASQELLTAQALYDHDLQQESYSQDYNFCNATQRTHATPHEATAATLHCGPTAAMQGNGMITFNNMFSGYIFQHTLMHRDQSRDQRLRVSSTYAEDGLNTPTYQASNPWPQSSEGEHTIGEPRYDDNYNAPQYWDLGQARELNSSGSDLAGIGAHFDGAYCQDYTGVADIEVDQSYS